MNIFTTIKDLPVSERPYERCEQMGPEYLTDAELIAVIIRTGTKSKKAIDLANEVLMLDSNNQGLLGLNHITFNQLVKVKGIGRIKAIQILCVVELVKRMAKTTYSKGVFFVTPCAIAEYYMQEMRHLDNEKVILLLLNSKNKLIKEINLSKGTVNASLITPREVFIYALKYEAVNIALLHNHPSGDSSPSKGDVDITKRVRDVGKLVGIKLLDHIILGDNEYSSLMEMGLM